MYQIVCFVIETNLSLKILYFPPFLNLITGARPCSYMVNSKFFEQTT